jgi:predicted tellurium resistance membrane protein TerC
MTTFRALAAESVEQASYFRRMFNGLAAASALLALICFSSGIYLVHVTSFPFAWFGVSLIITGSALLINAYDASRNARRSFQNFMAIRQQILENADRFEKES